MRNLSPSVTSKLNRKLGISTTLIIGVEWVDGSTVYYTSTQFPGANKSVVSLSGLETTVFVEGSGATQSVTVTLSDTDGKLTEILNTVDVHKRPAKVYLGFDQIPIAESVLLIDGEINSEISWDDAARTLTFTILSKIEGREFGFAVEDGLFHKVDPRARTTPWPFRFGETCSYPAVRIRNGVTGILKVGQGVLDPTLDAKICQARQINCPLIPDPLASADEPESPDQNLTLARSTFPTDPFEVNENTPFGVRLSRPTNENGETASTGRRSTSGNVPMIPDRRCEREKFKKLCQYLRDRANQLVYVGDTLEVVGGNDFPQGVTVGLRVDDVQYTGTFSGETFTIETTNRMDKPEEVDCTQPGRLREGYGRVNESQPSTLAECETPTNTFELRLVGGAGEAWRALGEHPDSGFKWLPAGTDVYLENSSTEVHVVSLVPGTVDGVFAYRTFADTQVLTELPSDYYEVVTTDYGDLEAVEIHLTRPLKSYPDENWDDTVYVQFTSDVGPNPVDVMEWIIERYTDFSIDSANFASVKSKLTKYPCNYYHAKKENVLSTLSRIAYESRCALTVTDNVVKLTYLSEEPTSVRTLNTSNVVAGSFKFLHTRTEDLITSQKVNWQTWGAPVVRGDEVQKSLTVQSNVKKYGYFGNEKTYETINHDEQALKTATFWSIRDSNTYRIVELQAGLENIDLELFDCVTLDLPVFPNVKAVVTGMSVQPADGVVDLQLWTPVLSGTTEEYFWAWPAGKPAEPYPSTNYQIETPLINITPPEDHPLYVDPQSSDPVVSPTVGDRFPTDLDDVVPTLICQDVTDPLLVDAIEPQFNRIDFTDYDAEGQNADDKAAEDTGVNVEPPDEDDAEACGRPTFEGCVWEVYVIYGRADSTGEANGSGIDDCSIEPGPCNNERGVRCTGPNYTWCKTFGSDIMAQAYKDSMQQAVERAYCNFTPGKTAPVAVTGPFKKDNSDTFPCIGMGDTEVDSGG